MPIHERVNTLNVKKKITPELYLYRLFLEEKFLKIKKIKKVLMIKTVLVYLKL